jgi:hypothetical protein
MWGTLLPPLKRGPVTQQRSCHGYQGHPWIAAGASNNSTRMYLTEQHPIRILPLERTTGRFSCNQRRASFAVARRPSAGFARFCAPGGDGVDRDGFPIEFPAQPIWSAVPARRDFGFLSSASAGPVRRLDPANAAGQRAGQRRLRNKKSERPNPSHDGTQPRAQKPVMVFDGAFSAWEANPTAGAMVGVVCPLGACPVGTATAAAGSSSPFPALASLCRAGVS